MTVRSFVVALACVSSWLLPAGPAQGADPNVVPEVLMDLGAIQRRTGELEEAQANYEMAIEQIEDASGVYDTRLIAALSGLGAVLHDQGHFGEAVEVVDRAMYVSRMNAGLHNLNQVELLNQLTESLVALGEFQTASDKQAYSFTLLRRAYGLRNPAIIPGVYRLASWYRRIGDIYVARSLYDHAVEVLEEAYGPEDPRLIPALQGLALTYRLERFPSSAGTSGSAAGVDLTTGAALGPEFSVIAERSRIAQINRYGDGERALKRTVLIYEKSENVDPSDRASAILDLADWYLLFEKWGRAFDTYDLAHQVILSQPSTAARIDEYFGDPTPLYFPLPQPGISPYSETKQGFIDVEYDVSDRGEVAAVRVTDANPPELIDFRMRRYVRLARFRPRFESGKPTGALALTYRHNFTYTEREKK